MSNASQNVASYFFLLATMLLSFPHINQYMKHFWILLSDLAVDTGIQAGPIIFFIVHRL